MQCYYFLVEYLLSKLTYIYCVIFAIEGIKLLERIIFFKFYYEFHKNSIVLSLTNILAV